VVVAATAPALLRTQAYVGGRWTEADDGATFAVLNPATGETLAELPRLGARVTGRAIKAAARALPAWKARSAKDRARVLVRLASLMADHEDELASLMVLEQASLSRRPAPRSPTRSRSTSGSPRRPNDWTGR
jgi:succinate-semialdehyde dehydrogenase/glutarate-semialdehyde dehydrogenase